MTAESPNIFALVLDKVRAANTALAADGVMPAGLDQSRIVVEPPRDPTHGDMATNAAMVLAKDAGKKPRDLAEVIAAKLRADPLIAKVDVAGLDEDRARDWAVLRAVLNAVWELDEPQPEAAEITRSITIAKAVQE